MAACARCPLAAAAPRSEDWPRGRQGLVVAAPFIFLFALEEVLPCSRARGQGLRRFPELSTWQGLLLRRVGLVAVIVVLAIFNTVLGEELLFRGLLLPRMRASSEECDWVANGVLFARTTCICRGSSRPPWWTSSLSPTPRGGSRARGWGSSCTRLRASSSSLSSSPSCCDDHWMENHG